MKKQSVFKYLLLAFVAGILPYTGHAQSWEQMTPIPTPSASATGCVLNGRVYVIGGQPYNSIITDQVQIYDPATDTWDDDTVAPLPVPLYRATSAVVNGKIYVFGGLDNVEITATASKLVFEYDPGTNTWTQKTDMPTPRFDAESAVVDGKIFVIGGEEQFPTASTTVEMYDPLTDTWATKAGMPAEIIYFTANTLNGKIYVIGGGFFWPMTIHPSFKAYSYDPDLNTWSQENDLPAPLVHHGSGVMGRKIYLFGGLIYTGFDNVTWEYDPEDENAWTSIESPFPFTSILNFVSAVAGDENGQECLYAIGGYASAYLNTVYKHCFTANPVEEVKGVPANALEINVNPNPFAQITAFNYKVKKSGEVMIKIYAPSGSEVMTIREGFLPAGEHRLELDTSGLPSGVYFFKINGEGYMGTGKFLKQG